MADGFWDALAEQRMAQQQEAHRVAAETAQRAIEQSRIDLERRDQDQRQRMWEAGAQQRAADLEETRARTKKYGKDNSEPDPRDQNTWTSPNCGDGRSASVFPADLGQPGSFGPNPFAGPPAQISLNPLRAGRQSGQTWLIPPLPGVDPMQRLRGEFGLEHLTAYPAMATLPEGQTEPLPKDTLINRQTMQTSAQKAQAYTDIFKARVGSLKIRDEIKQKLLDERAQHDKIAETIGHHRSDAVNERRVIDWT